MKKNKNTIKYIIFLIILYIIGFLIVISVSSANYSSSDMFPGLTETLHAIFYSIIFISIALFIAGIILLKKDQPKSKFKKAILYYISIIVFLSIIFYSLTMFLIQFIIPVAAITTNIILKGKNKKRIKIAFIILFILLVIRIILSCYSYISWSINNRMPYNGEYTCKNYITSNNDYYYCQADYGIKRVNKNNLNEKKYASANYLFSEYDNVISNEKINNKNNTNYIYYEIYKENYRTLDADYELHVIDMENNTDTKIKYLKKEIIMSAITDENGNLFYQTSDSKDNDHAYYYKVNNNKTIEIKNTNLITDFYYLKDNKLYYRNYGEKDKDFYSYNLLNNNIEKNGTANGYIYKSTIIDNYRYQLYNNQIIKYDINNFSNKTTIETNQNEVLDNIKINNNKLYVFSLLNNRITKLIGYYDLDTNIFINNSYEFNALNYNYIVDNNYLYLIDKEDKHLYKYNLTNKTKELISDKRLWELQGIDNNIIYLKTNKQKMIIIDK